MPSDEVANTRRSVQNDTIGLSERVDVPSLAQQSACANDALEVHATLALVKFDHPGRQRFA